MDAPTDDNSHAVAGPRAGTRPTAGQRFRASWVWLVLKNLLGWLLILAAFVAGPLVPGPGGIPLFLIGFALVSFPGKRRITARVLRGKPVRFPGGPFLLICVAVAATVPALALLIGHGRSAWLASMVARGPAAVVVLYVVGALLAWALVRSVPHVLNLVLRLVSRTRRKFRPWPRRHRFRLLPPRWRRRYAHEPGSGPLRLTDGILKLYRRP